MKNISFLENRGKMNNTELAKNLINSKKLKEAESLLLGLEDKYSVFELARLRQIQGKDIEAEKLFLRTLQISPEIKGQIESDTNLELARIYARQRKVDLASRMYLKVTDRINSERNIYKELGNLYMQVRDFQKAEKNYERAIAIFPKDIDVAINLGIIYRMLGKDEKSGEIFNGLLKIKEIKQDKFIYNKILNEYEILLRKEYLESHPMEIMNTITNRCNIGCRSCDIWKDGNWKQNEKRMKEVVELFPYLEQVSWLGGETFLYKGFDDILEEGFKYKNMEQTILTNGLLLTKNSLEKMLKEKVVLWISIDAGKKETYEYLKRGASWDKLCKNLEMIKEAKEARKNSGSKVNMKTLFNAVISKSNYKEMMEMLEMAKKYAFDRIRFQPIFGSGEENIFVNRNMEAVNYIYNLLDLLKAKAEEYEIEVVFDSLFPTREYPIYRDLNMKYVEGNNYSVRKTVNKMVSCESPWKRIVMDSKGTMRMCINSNDYLGDSEKETIEGFWNNKGMQTYRKYFGKEMMACSGKDYKMSSFGPDDILDDDYSDDDNDDVGGIIHSEFYCRQFCGMGGMF